MTDGAEVAISGHATDHTICRIVRSPQTFMQA